MSYEKKKQFVLNHLADGGWHSGVEIVEASRGQIIQKNAYLTFDRDEISVDLL